MKKRGGIWRDFTFEIFVGAHVDGPRWSIISIELWWLSKITLMICDCYSTLTLKSCRYQKLPQSPATPPHLIIELEACSSMWKSSPSENASSSQKSTIMTGLFEVSI